MSSPIHARAFGRLPSGEPVEAYTLKGSAGLELEAITYGGIVVRLLAPDRRGRKADVVLGFGDFDSYLAGHPFFGAIAGRVAGRITGAQFALDGKLHRLAVNDPPNHLHGGTRALDKRLWKAKPAIRDDGSRSLRLTCRSPDGDEGYPGNLEIAVTYTVTNDNTFLIETEASTDRATPLNLTHHSYFNLAGEGSGSVEDHELQIHADTIIACDDHMTLLGKAVAVNGTAADLNRARRLGDVMPGLFRNHGDLYRLRRPVGDGAGDPLTLVPAARLTHPATGRMLEVRTSESYLQFYTGASLDGSCRGKSGVHYGRHAGLCLECENYPDGANAPAWGDIILRPESVQRHVTAYAFSTF